MQREIKFRAWNGEQMVSPDYISRDGYGHWRENSIPESSNILMQYTGLLDRNSKEIYEGDIVTGGGLPGIVEYFAPSFHFRHIGGKGASSWLEGTVEIIGNIYEGLYSGEQCQKWKHKTRLF